MSKFNKQKTIDKIVDDFTECRISSEWFPHSETQIEWSTHQEIYYKRIQKNDDLMSKSQNNDSIELTTKDQIKNQ